MHIIGFIVQGDRTSHGGQVLDCQSRRSINGIRVARIGDPVWCPRCKRMAKIISSRYPQVTDDNIPVAFDQDMTDCGALLYSRFNDYAGYSAGGDDGDRPSKKTKTASGSSNQTASAQEHFILYCRVSGKELEGIAYTLKTQDGDTIDGETDELGRTNVAWTGSPDEVSLALRPQAGKSDDPYHFPESLSEDN